MSKVITFSRTFPSYHPEKGQPTYFVEAIYKSLYIQKVIPNELHDFDYDKFINGYAKHHTIRAGSRFKVGDKFSPRVWGNDVNQKSGRSGPYHSKQIIIAPDIEVKKVWEIEISEGLMRINNEIALVTEIAKNDGLEYKDFIHWFFYSPDFKKTQYFRGQIICWNENIEY